MFLAQAMLCGAGDTLLALQSLIGAVGMVAFTCVPPDASLDTPKARVWLLTDCLLIVR